MLFVEMHSGEGLGNQLARYIATRVIAKDNGYELGILHPEKIKCLDFMELDLGCKIPDNLLLEIKNQYTERKILHPENGADIRLFDENLIHIADNTFVDGIMQDEQYIFHRKDEIREWLKVKSEFECYDYSDENTCVINFRGGEYVRHRELYLEKNYWENAVKNMLAINKNFRFVVVTDDVFSAKKLFPFFEVVHFNIAKDYIIIKNAHYLILSNSSFAWFPAWLNENLKCCIAPKYWARHNISNGYWCLGYNITKGWMYQDRNGNLSDYNTCKKEFSEFIKNNKSLFDGSRAYVPTHSKRIYLYLKNNITPIWIKNFFKKCIIKTQQIILRIKNRPNKRMIEKSHRDWIEKIKSNNQN